MASGGESAEEKLRFLSIIPVGRQSGKVGTLALSASYRTWCEIEKALDSKNKKNMVQLWYVNNGEPIKNFLLKYEFIILSFFGKNLE